MAVRHRDKNKLTPVQRAFAMTYLANGFNASAAYRSTHPNASEATARVEAHRTLTTPAVKAFVNKRMVNRWKTLQMDGDEALGRVAMDARADIRLLYDAKGGLLKPQDWPDEIVNSIEGIELRDDGSTKVKLASKTLARRTILQQTGKLKGTGAGRTLARILAGDFDEDDDE